MEFEYPSRGSSWRASYMVEEASLNRYTRGMSDRDTELRRMSSIFSMAHSPRRRPRLSVHSCL
jgi:hypothetical protein